ncbi:universal stress protein [Leptobacterium flavescens]|uniref:Universal stress protein n=1 Tax=Leptobacterium flavescens TaxID=472055 RepID=A0A6P0UP71_9FLAO|nr:universal stress protein [Leptobacterium flavescens]NER14240.1 universal stress protein [Leptobacterium flavescens]
MTALTEKYQFKTILTGIAFSPNLRANLYEAMRLSTFFGAKLILVHVGPKTPQKEEVLELIMSEFEESAENVDVVWKEGNPVNVILEACKSFNVDLLILGALQKEQLFKYYLGSIARKITRKAPCSVLLLINPSVNRVACKHIVVNGLEDPKTREAIHISFGVAKDLGANRVTIVEEISQNEVHVVVSDDRSLRKATIMKARIEKRETTRVNDILKAIPEQLKTDINIKTQSIFGRRGYSIGHYAKLVRADLLIMNAPNKLGLIDRIFPHDLEYILSEIPTDVLIIK